MNKLAPALLGALLLPGSVILAQAADTSALERRVAELEKQIHSMHNTSNSSAASDHAPIDRYWLKRDFVSAGTSNMNVSISGQVNRAIVYVDDGHNGELVNVDNNYHGTRLRVVGTADINDGFTMGSRFEFGADANSSSAANQFDTNTGIGTYRGRIYEIYGDWADFGRLTLGHGKMASDDMTELSLNGASLFEMSLAASPAEGFYLRDRNETNAAFRTRVTAAGATAASAPTLGDAFSNLDGGRDDRVRYDSVRWKGMQASVAYASMGFWDAAITHNADYDNFETLSAIAYRHDDSGDEFVNGSLSMLHKPSGMTFTYNGARKDGDKPATATTNLDSEMDYFQLGWNADLNCLGQTSFAVGYYMGEDMVRTGDESDAMGFAIHQAVDKIGAEFYIMAKQFDYDDRQAARNWDKMNLIAVGGLVRF